MRLQRTILIGTTFYLIISLVVSGVRPKPADAVPQFAQALGVNCDFCHTVVPGLNAFGRWMLRTGFWFPAKSFSDPGIIPVSALETLRDASTRHADTKAPADTASIGNLTAFFAGPAGDDFSYEYVQSLYSGNVGGQGDFAMWIAYHGLLDHNLHLSVGKQSPEGPAFFSVGQPDITGYKTQSIAVDQHTFHITSSNWGPRAYYQHGSLDAELDYGVSGINGTASNLIQAADFNQGAGSYRQIAWKLASANASRFFEYGLYGTVGGDYVLKGLPGAIDRYGAQGVFFQSDPRGYLPGLDFFYQTTQDSNAGLSTPPSYTAGLPVGPVASHGGGIELQEMLLHDPNWPLMLSLRHEVNKVNNTGSGSIMAGNVVDLSATFPKLTPYLVFHAEVATGNLYTSNNGTTTPPSVLGRPTWTYTLEYAGPIKGPFNRTVSSRQEDLMNGPNAGAEIYTIHCAACHQVHGQGVPGNYPALAGDPRVYIGDGAGFVGVILNGLNKEMPAFRNYLTDAQVAAVATYIRSAWGNHGTAVNASAVTAVRAGQPIPAPAVAAGMSGADLYAAKCAACHGANGQGVPGTFPPLAGNAVVNGSDLTALITVAEHGRGMMPAFRSQLSNADLAAVLTYIRSSFGNHGGPVTEADVTGVK